MKNTTANPNRVSHGDFRMKPVSCRFKGPGIAATLATLIILLCLAPFAGAQNGSKMTLKIALLPIPDALPYYVAEAKGYFKALGITATAVPVASGLERDQLMQSGQIDGMLNELITTANFNRRRIQVKTVMTARRAYAHYPLFRLLAAPASSLRSPADLTGVPVGISMNTVIEYVTDRLLSAEGFDPQKIVKKSVPVIPERFQLLLQGQIKAATLPDPLAASALAGGARQIVADSSHPEYSVSVLSFNVAALENKPQAIRGFLKAWDRAVVQINQKPESFHDLLLKKIRVPANIRDTFKIPPYPRHRVPDASQWADVMQWMTTKGLLASPLDYNDSVTAAYLP